MPRCSSHGRSARVSWRLPWFCCCCLHCRCFGESGNPSSDQGGKAMGFKIRRVGHLVLNVKDVERSKKFFQEVLGFPVVAQNQRGMVFFSTDVKDNHHMLAICPAKEGAAMPGRDQVGMQHVSFELGRDRKSV